MKLHPRSPKIWIVSSAAALVLTSAEVAPAFADHEDGSSRTKTPIKHVVIIFGENESFDHYFATYPMAQNTEQPLFKAAPDTPAVNGLSAGLLSNNPNLFNPVRLGREDAYTCSFNHDYTAEQKAADGGLLDKFVQATSRTGTGCATDGSTVMDYFDGNTVTALWNYAQHFAMNDNSFDTNFGPSTVGAINLVSGQTGNGHLATSFANGKVSGFTPVTVTGDPDPALDDCGADAGGTKASGKDRGDARPQRRRPVESQGRHLGLVRGWLRAHRGRRGECRRLDQHAGGVRRLHIEHQYGVLVVPNPTINPGADIHVSTADYSPHHQPFQYYASTRNQHHLPPRIGGGDRS